MADRHRSSSGFREAKASGTGEVPGGNTASEGVSRHEGFALSQAVDGIGRSGAGRPVAGAEGDAGSRIFAESKAAAPSSAPRPAPSPSDPVLQAKEIRKKLGGKTVLKGIDLDIRHGECFGIIGPNGSGKSTLVKLLSGADAHFEGDIRYLGKPLSAYTRKQLARHIAVLQQEALPPLGFTVREVVEMGRYPYQNWLGEDTEDAASVIDEIIRELDIRHLVDRPVERLSGGERQRVALAKTAAQQPELLMLDEPTTYLDIGYQQQMMEFIRRWQRRDGLTVVAVLHDLNLAALYCDRILVLHDGRVVETGKPEDVIRADLLAEVYGIRPEIVRHPVAGVPQILLPGPL